MSRQIAIQIYNVCEQRGQVEILWPLKTTFNDLERFRSAVLTLFSLGCFALQITPSSSENMQWSKEAKLI